jgi:hypothetical protein
VWLPSGVHYILFGRLTVSQQTTSSGYRELLPLRIVLDFLTRQNLLPVDSVVALWSDSQVASVYLDRWASPCPEVLAELEQLWTIIASLNIMLTVTWCSRRDGWIPLSDLVSKASFAPSPEYALSDHTFRYICVAAGVNPSVNLFASAATAKLRDFCSRSLAGVSPDSIRRLAQITSATHKLPIGAPEHIPVASRGWLGGAYDIPWAGRSLYAYPPWTQVPIILAFWASISATAPPSTSLLILVKSSFFPLLQQHPDLVQRVNLPSDVLLLDPMGKPCAEPPPWPLAAFLLRR